jgi:hypothetical protein
MKRYEIVRELIAYENKYHGPPDEKYLSIVRKCPTPGLEATLEAWERLYGKLSSKALPSFAKGKDA